MHASLRNKRKVNAIPITRKEFEEDLPGRFLACQNIEQVRSNQVESSISSSTSGDCPTSTPITFHEFKNQTLKFLQRKSRSCAPEEMTSRSEARACQPFFLRSSKECKIDSERIPNPRNMDSTYLNTPKSYHSSQYSRDLHLFDSQDEFSDHGELTHSLKNMLQVQQKERYEQEMKKRFLKQQLLSFIQPQGDLSEPDTERMQISRSEYQSDDTENGPGSSIIKTQDSSFLKNESLIEKGNVTTIKQAIESCLGSKEAGLMTEVLDCSQGHHFVILLENDEFCGVYWQDEKLFLHRIFGYPGTPAAILPSTVTKRYAFLNNKFRVLKSSDILADAVSIA